MAALSPAVASADARVWHVVPSSDDDNPNIRKYMGSGDVVTRYQAAGGYVTSMLLRRNLASGRGFVQLDWTAPAPRRAEVPCPAQLRLRRDAHRLQPPASDHRRRRVIRRLV